MRELDKQNPPVVDSVVGQIHYGNTPLVKWLRIIPALQAVSAFVLLMAGVYIVRTRGNAERERVWAGMARESAHQLGTPLSSLAGWIELLEERGADARREKAAPSHARRPRRARPRGAALRTHRPARRATNRWTSARWSTGSRYFRARVPTLANAVTIDVQAPDESFDGARRRAAARVGARGARQERARRARGARRPHHAADRAHDRRGWCSPSTTTARGAAASSPATIFEPGFSTKTSGWGIGLSLARRIVEENHGGTLQLAAVDRGASFEIILP